jgi:hypothetical protein
MRKIPILSAADLFCGAGGTSAGLIDAAKLHELDKNGFETIADGSTNKEPGADVLEAYTDAVMKLIGETDE